MFNNENQQSSGTNNFECRYIFTKIGIVAWKTLRCIVQRDIMWQYKGISQSCEKGFNDDENL